MHPAIQAAVAVLRSRRGRKLFIAIAAGLVVAFLALAMVIASTIGAIASVCEREAQSSGGPSGYVSQEFSQEGLDTIPEDYLTVYRDSAQKYGIDAMILAAVGQIETEHGQGGKSNTCVSSPAGAQGPMQFMPETWAQAGLDGDGDGREDVCDYRDAIPAAAKYLVDGGAPEDYRAALFQYNRANWYVEDVLEQAEEYRGAKGEGSGDGPASTAGTEEPPQGWDLVDEDRKIHYELDTAYASYFEAAAGDWNALGGVSIEPSPSPEETDLVVSDGPAGGSMGKTYSDNRMVVDPSVMDGATDNARYAVFGHELGHALGFEHTPEQSVMVSPIITNFDENVTVPTGYDKALYGDTWGGSAGGALQTPQAAPSDDPGSSGDPGGSADTPTVSGNASAVFPLPKEHLDDYDDTWGAARSQGGHEGTDMFAPDGTPIYSVVTGKVIPVAGSDEEGWNALGGWTTMIEATESVGPVQAGDTFYYAHQLEPSPLRPGDTVEAGDQVGKVGSSGEGPPGALLPDGRGKHLHLGWYDSSMSRAETASGAMNPYSLLQWLGGNGGTASGGDAGGLAPGGRDVPGYCRIPGLGGIGETLGGLGDGGSSDTEPGSGEAGELLENPNVVLDPRARGDLESGVVDERLVAALQAIAEKQKIEVRWFKTGHILAPGIPEGPTIPAGYPGTGAPNAHYLGRGADIFVINDQPVAGRGEAADVVDVGRTLQGLPAGERPDAIIGPPEWHAALGAEREMGFIDGRADQELHGDHLHIGFQQDSGTANAK